MIELPMQRQHVIGANRLAAGELGHFTAGQIGDDADRLQPDIPGQYQRHDRTAAIPAFNVDNVRIILLSQDASRPNTVIRIAKRARRQDPEIPVTREEGVEMRVL